MGRTISFAYLHFLHYIWLIPHYRFFILYWCILLSSLWLVLLTVLTNISPVFYPKGPAQGLFIIFDYFDFQILYFCFYFLLVSVFIFIGLNGNISSFLGVIQVFLVFHFVYAHIFFIQFSIKGHVGCTHPNNSLWKVSFYWFFLLFQSFSNKCHFIH